MAELPRQNLPPVVGECVTTMQPPQPGAIAGQTVTRMVRSADGKIRSDFGKTSVITDMAARRTTILDHAKKIAHVVPIPAEPAVPSVDPSAFIAKLGSAVPPLPSVKKVEDLGTSMIDGLEVVGKRITLQPPAMPQAPALPSPPVISEVWTSTKLDLPVLTKTQGSFGEQIRRCKYTQSAEPPPTLFQIPQGYTMVTPTVPKPPGVPG